ncbi:transporter substrate-binding domain-containing protein [Faucicola atlantae]|uniref:transporter substrate-binding domain-containing protein n=1 Tax=Faucicola atlantae TaxID=34059 RepID=UPI0025B0CB48|nr:transporter substrate-binding domain-containing protein [Moraxella atlantae]
MSVMSYAARSAQQLGRLSRVALCVAAVSVSACQQANDAASDAATSATHGTATSGKKSVSPPKARINHLITPTAMAVLAGYDVDVAKAVCAELKADCQIVAQDWDGIIPGLLAGKYDAIVSGMSVTPERAAQVDFTQPYYKNTIVWLAPTTGKFNPANIKGYKLATQRSTTLGQYLQDHFKADNDLKLYDTYDNAFMDLKSGRVDSVLAEKVTASEWLKQNHDKFAIMGDEIDNNDNIAIAVRRNDALKGELDQALTTLKNNGQLDKLQQQHFAQ